MGLKRLMIINGNQFGYSAGHYYYCKYLAGQYVIDYVCFDKGKRKMALEGVKVHYVSAEAGKIMRIVRFIKTSVALSKTIKPEILFVVYFHLCFLLALFCKSSRFKLLDIRTGSLQTNSLKRRLFNSLIKIQSSFYDKRVILSESLLKELGITSKNTVVLPLGAEIFYAGSHDFLCTKLIYVGTLDNRRIYETINGLTIFLKKFPHIQAHYDLVGFGSSAEIKRLSEAIANNGLSEVVTFHGELNHSEINSFFSNNTIGVAYIPQEDYYQFQPATKIFEYALSGLFTIATTTFENKRVISPANGVLCEDNAASFADALEYYHIKRNSLNSSVIRNSLINYEWRSLVKNTLEPFLSN
jgi:hypothetical protein